MGPGCPPPEAAEVTNVSFMQSTQALRYQRMGRAVGGGQSAELGAFRRASGEVTCVLGRMSLGEVGRKSVFNEFIYLAALGPSCRTRDPRSSVPICGELVP